MKLNGDDWKGALAKTDIFIHLQHGTETVNDFENFDLPSREYVPQLADIRCLFAQKTLIMLCWCCCFFGSVEVGLLHEVSHHKTQNKNKTHHKTLYTK